MVCYRPYTYAVCAMLFVLAGSLLVFVGETIDGQCVTDLTLA